MGILLSVLVVSGVTVLIGYPLLRPAAQPLGDPQGPAARIRTLEERKLQIYAAIRELGFDFRSDKLLPADYEEEVEKLKRDAVAVVRELDELRQQPPRGPDSLEAEIAAVPAGAVRATPPAPADATDPDAAYCTQCGAAAAADDRFCGACGAPLRRAT